MKTPPWIATLANELSTAIRPFDLLSPLGCHLYRNRAIDQWEITLFASSTEIVGGPRDGETTVCRFHLDLAAATGLFDEVLAFHWQTHVAAPDDDLGPHVSIEGVYAGHSVWVRVLGEPPERFGAGRALDVNTRQLEDNWS